MIYLLLALALLLAFVAFIYNSLVRSKNRCEAAWSDIDAQLKRRYDLIPNLVETVKGYAKHEAGTLEKITKARTDAMNAQGMHDKEAAENMLSSALKSIFALAENYPDLKANQNFLDLQKIFLKLKMLSKIPEDSTMQQLKTLILKYKYFQTTFLLE